MSQQINLLNIAFIKRTTYVSLPGILLALGLIIASILSFYGYGLFQLRQLEEQYTVATARYTDDLARNGKQLGELSAQQNTQALQEEAKRLESRLASQNRLIESQKSVGNTEGFSEYLRAFSRQLVQGLWLSRFNIEATQFSLSGYAAAPELLPVYIQRLGKERIMQGKTFANLEMSHTTQGAIEFSLQSNPVSEEKK